MMGSSAKEFKTRIGSESEPQIGDLNSVFAALGHEESFSHCEIETPEPGCVCLSDDCISIIFLSAEIWSDRERSRPFFDNMHQGKLRLVCIGTKNELNSRPSFTFEENLSFLCLPMTPTQLTFSVENFFSLQRAVFLSEKEHLDDQHTNESVKYVMRVSRELNGVRDTNKLLSLILRKARDITNADAGSIYVVEWHDRECKEGTIHFKITQNETVAVSLAEFQIPITENSIVGNAVIHGKPINIPDLYKLNPDPELNPYKARHDKKFDERLGYQSRSMLTVPMFDISHQVIGVIQLINRKKNGIKTLKVAEDFSKQVTFFEDQIVEYAEIMAQQAGIALENAFLTEEKEQLFEGFVHASVTAIEQRDPTTSGHSHRVAQLTVGTAEVINRIATGKFASVHFNEDQIKELEFASLLHDFGKLGVREQVLVKAKKLYAWELDLLLERFELIKSQYEIDALKEAINFYKSPQNYPPDITLESFYNQRDGKIKQLDEFLTFILKSNEPTVLEQGGFERLKDIANLHFKTREGNSRPFLADRELKALSVSRGSLTREEFAEIQSHVTHTYEFLRKIPWGSKFANVPQIAAKHHEKLDGSGYPTQASATEIPLQTRIMTIADIFDALTASDRPYKKAVPTEKALDILSWEVKSGKCDADLFALFLESKIYESVIDNQRKSR